MSVGPSLCVVCCWSTCGMSLPHELIPAGYVSLVLRVGVIGVGVMGGAHARYLSGRVRSAAVVAVCDKDPGRAERVAETVAAKVVTDPQELIASESVDAVVIASPDSTHVDLALAALDANRPALVEKPLAERPSGASSVVAAEVAGGHRLLSLGFMRRFDPAHTSLWRHLQEGTIGGPRLFRSIHRNPVPPPRGSTRATVAASGIHDIDCARWLLGDFVRVRAVGIPERPGGTLDLVHIQGEHVNGGLSSIEVSTAAGYGYEVTAEIVGKMGVVSTVDSAETDVRVAGQRVSAIPQIWLDRFEAAYLAELEAWVDATVSGEMFGGASAWDGYVAQLVAEAVIDSLDSNAPVDILPLDRPDIYV